MLFAIVAADTFARYERRPCYTRELFTPWSARCHAGESRAGSGNCCRSLAAGWSAKPASVARAVVAV